MWAYWRIVWAYLGIRWAYWRIVWAYLWGKMGLPEDSVGLLRW